MVFRTIDVPSVNFSEIGQKTQFQRNSSPHHTAPLSKREKSNHLAAKSSGSLQQGASSGLPAFRSNYLSSLKYLQLTDAADLTGHLRQVWEMSFFATDHNPSLAEGSKMLTHLPADCIIFTCSHMAVTLFLG